MTNQEKSTGGNNLVRIILFAILGVISIVAVLEFSARGKASTAYAKIDAAIATGASVERSQVHEWMHREPTHVTETDAAKHFVESYEFPGLLRTRTIDVEYSHSATDYVHAVSIK